jgi:hygromycin-B 7''-O-kinase
MQRPAFASVQDYGRNFTNLDYWRPYVEAVCVRHGFRPCRTVRTGLPGTMPVFIVDERVVVKFFAEYFQGDTGFRVERAVYGLLAGRADIPAPAFLASGELFPEGDGWPWPYLVVELLPGRSLAEVADKVSAADRLAVAQYLAPILRRLHRLQLDPSSHLRPTWDAFDAFLAGRRANVIAQHRRWRALPERLIAQIADYLPPLAELVDHRLPPHLLHCDLNADHVLGGFTGEHWQPTGVIDFGDAKVGDRLYELEALHIGLFYGDKRLLRAFLDAYGFDPELRRDFTRRAMSMALLHEFNVLGEVTQRFPAAAGVASLEALAALLWDLERPGLGQEAMPR